MDGPVGERVSQVLQSEMKGQQWHPLPSPLLPSLKNPHQHRPAGVALGQGPGTSLPPG